MFAGCIITSDVNIRLSDMSSTYVPMLNVLLGDFGLHEVVHQLAHNHSQQLDVFNMHTDQSTRYATVDPLLIYDHSLITVMFGVSSTQTSTRNPLVWRR